MIGCNPTSESLLASPAARTRSGCEWRAVPQTFESPLIRLMDRPSTACSKRIGRQDACHRSRSIANVCEAHRTKASRQGCISGWTMYRNRSGHLYGAFGSSEPAHGAGSEVLPELGLEHLDGAHSDRDYSSEGESSSQELWDQSGGRPVKPRPKFQLHIFNGVEMRHPFTNWAATHWRMEVSGSFSLRLAANTRSVALSGPK
jgi:hypothetical protein